MSDAISFFTKEAERVVEHLKDEYAKLQIGRATTALVDTIKVESYGAMQDMKNVASISIPDSKTIQIQPWDKTMLAGIEKAIRISDMGLNPVNNGTSIMLNMPPMTEERRKDLVKIVKKMAEEAKISVRTHRQKSMDIIKKEELPKDQQAGAEKKLQEHVDKLNGMIEEVAKKKETDIMTV